jgi:polyhydroxybutyrate depolymerase
MKATAPVAGSTVTLPTAGTSAGGAPAVATGGASAATAGAPAGGTSAAVGGMSAAAGSGGSIEVKPAACPADSKLKPGDTTNTIMVGGMSRGYILHIPPGYDGKTPMPLVIDWHPLLADDQYQRTMSGYAALGDKEGFVTLFPNGIDNAWNIGPCCTMSRMIDDLGFARALVEKMRSDACIDMKRVYSAGYSMGGGMTHYLGCNAADLFAAISPAAFDLLEEDEEPCKPARPLTEIQFRGTADPIVPYMGGASTPPTAYPLSPIHFRGAVGTFKHWAELNKCTGDPEMGSGGCQTYKQCAAGVEVTLCTKTGGGHDTGDANVGWATLKRFSMP